MTVKPKPFALRKPRKTNLPKSTVSAYSIRCRAEILRHHIEMKHDPEHLTTEFMIEITKCNCLKEMK